MIGKYTYSVHVYFYKRNKKYLFKDYLFVNLPCHHNGSGIDGIHVNGATILQLR